MTTTTHKATCNVTPAGDVLDHLPSPPSASSEGAGAVAQSTPMPNTGTYFPKCDNCGQPVHAHAAPSYLCPQPAQGEHEQLDALANPPALECDARPGDRFATFAFNPALHVDTADLVARFAAALAAKLHAAQEKYGYSDGWRTDDWMDECRAKLVEHVAKGDPRDVAAYCAFLWHHGERTALPRGLPAGSDAPFDIYAHLQRQREWSERTFGPGARTAGVVDHIRKELREIEADPKDVSEWIDVVILALDGAWRAGYSPREIVDAIVAKQTKNECRAWPDWRTMPADKAIEHDRSADATAEQPAGSDAVRQAWRAAITLANNICVQESDRENDNDGNTGWIDGTAECAKRIREFVEPDDAQLVEMLTENGATAAVSTLAAAEQPSCGQDARDAAKWRSLHRFVKYGEFRVPGSSGDGRHFKIVEICPTFGDEKDRDFGELIAAIDAAIAAQQRQGGA